MSNYDSDGSPDSDWEDRGDLAWNEFDWERYLRAQDEAVNRYLAYYEAFLGNPTRIDEVARHMEWDNGEEPADEAAAAEEAAEAMAEDFGTECDVYTLHKNPIYISTRALYLRLRRKWELIATDPSLVPQPLAVSYLSSLQQGEDQAVQAVHALEFGDFAMAVSLFKRSLSTLNRSLALLNDAEVGKQRAVADYRSDALITLFDLREIWLRVISECRAELERPVEDEDN